MAMPDRRAVFDSLRAWVCKANPEAAAQQILPDTDLIALRLLESLQVVELVLYIESQTGKRILAESLHPDKLRTMNSIYENFF